jgi:predicted PurR-regulated permease PerM
MKAAMHEDAVRVSIEIAISLLLIFILLALCLQILLPFLSFVLWGGIIAIATHGLFAKLQSALGGRRKLAVALYAILGLAVIIVPAVLFVGSIVDSAATISNSLETGDFDVAPPDERVKDWPLIGEQVFDQWSAAAADFEKWLQDNNETVEKVLTDVLSRLASIGVGVLQFVLAVLIATAMLANSESIARGMRMLFQRIAGDESGKLLSLSTSTVRSVTTGVLGIAFIQAFLAGLGMLVAGVPAAGVWALLILILGIAQLPPLLILIPVIAYVFSVETTTVAVLFMVWSLLVSFSDIVLKPLLLGRGVEAPMLVILLGAIGGMLMFGIIGLFVGAVVLALGYSLLAAWLRSDESADEESATAT